MPAVVDEVVEGAGEVAGDVGGGEGGGEGVDAGDKFPGEGLGGFREGAGCVPEAFPAPGGDEEGRGEGGDEGAGGQGLEDAFAPKIVGIEGANEGTEDEEGEVDADPEEVAFLSAPGGSISAAKEGGEGEGSEGGWRCQGGGGSGCAGVWRREL
jgi:hypothetical protein